MKGLPTIYPHYQDADALELHTDASNLTVAAVLVQKRGRREFPVAYHSRMLKPAEKNYSTSEKELLAVHEALMHFRPYVSGIHITIKTDHQPLVGILTTKKSDRKSTRLNSSH